MDPLDDAQLLYDRAQVHVRSFNQLNDSRDGGLWRIDGGREGAEGPFTGTLVLDRAVLRSMKPVIGDIANNLIHALDHVAAVASRTVTDERFKNLHFTIANDDETYEKRRAEAGRYLDVKWLDLFTVVRERHRPFQGQLWLLKVISNTAKHWELVAGGAGAVAVGWHVPGEGLQRIVDIPRDHFATSNSFQFWRDATPLPRLPFQIVTSHRLTGLDGGDDADVNSVFSTSSRFVADVIAESRAMLG